MALEEKTYPLPDGSQTRDVDEFERAWNAILDPLSEYQLTPHSWYPGVTVIDLETQRTVSLTTALAKRMGKLALEVQNLRLQLAEYQKMDLDSQEGKRQAILDAMNSCRGFSVQVSPFESDWVYSAEDLRNFADSLVP